MGSTSIRERPPRKPIAPRLDPHHVLAPLCRFSSSIRPWASSRPRPSTITWSQTASTSGSRWLEKSRLIPLACDRSRDRSRISSRPAGSMPLVGSSRISSCGSWTMAEAILSRCFMPVE